MIVRGMLPLTPVNESSGNITILLFIKQANAGGHMGVQVNFHKVDKP